MISERQSYAVYRVTSTGSSFPVPFPLASGSTIRVSVRGADGILRELSSTEYSYDKSAGRVTISASLSVDDVVLLERITGADNGTSLYPGRPINPTTLNEQNDKAMAALRETRDRVSKALAVPMDEEPVTLPPAKQRAGTFLGFGDDGEVLMTDFRPYVTAVEEASKSANQALDEAKAEVEKAKEQVALATTQAELAEGSADNAKVYEENTKASFENFKKAIPQFVYNSSSDELTIFVQELTPETESHIISIPTAEDMENADTEHIEHLIALHDEMTAKYVIPITTASTVTVEGMGGEASFSALLATVTKTEIQDGLEAYQFEIPLRNDTGEGASYLLFYVGVKMAEVDGQILYVASGGSILMLPFFSDSYWAEIDGKGYSVTVTVSNPA